jgi:hypothetical protein
MINEVRVPLADKCGCGWIFRRRQAIDQLEKLVSSVCNGNILQFGTVVRNQASH